MSELLKNKYDFLMVFDITNGNPNGNPDDGGRPRIDPETSTGIVTDVCLKRKIRDYIEMRYEGKRGYDVYIKQGTPLNRSDKSAYDALKVEQNGGIATVKKNDPDVSLKVRDYMCGHYFDIRAFGAVMTTFVIDKLNCGQIKGPVQLSFAKSVDPIFPMDIAITRKAITKEDDAGRKNNEIGTKSIIPYGLFIAQGHISASLARKTGFNEDDLEILWSSICNMMEEDYSASRAGMYMRKLIIFKHDSIWGNAPAYKLFDSIKIFKRDGVVAPRSFSDYEIHIPDEMPEGVMCECID